MEKKLHGNSIDRKIRSGDIHHKEVVRRLAELAYGKSNDCVKLVLGTDTDLDKLDLTLLSEVKRDEKGKVDVKLVDRLRVLEQLAALTEAEHTGADAFLQGLQAGENG